uniref:Uncharacterized protein n=1 Tax=Cacopsylla melanoneura TaxID=428564 RepID=A0A8D9F3M3_9HEMI
MYRKYIVLMENRPCGRVILDMSVLMHLFVWCCKSTLGQRRIHFRPELNLVRCSARRLVSYPTHSFASQCFILITRGTHPNIRSVRTPLIVRRIVDKIIVSFFDKSFEFEALFFVPRTQVLP